MNFQGRVTSTKKEILRRSSNKQVKILQHLNVNPSRSPLNYTSIYMGFWTLLGQDLGLGLDI